MNRSNSNDDNINNSLHFLRIYCVPSALYMLSFNSPVNSLILNLSYTLENLKNILQMRKIKFRKYAPGHQVKNQQ